MANQFHYDSDPQCGGDIKTNAVPVSVLQTMRPLFDDEPVFLNIWIRMQRYFIIQNVPEQYQYP
jgi:hypothetical protein